MIRAIFNLKGGVGKTTICCNLAAAAAKSGKRALVVDLDPQANASRYLLGGDAEDATPTVADLFRQALGFRLFRDKIGEFVQPTRFDGLFVMPSDSELEELEPRIAAKHKIKILAKALDALDDYDEIFIDTPPAYNIFSISALVAAQRALLPFDCDDFSRQALYRVMEEIEEIAEDHNEDLRVEGIVATNVPSRAKLPRLLLEELVAEGLPVLEPAISTSVKVRESHQAAAPLPFFSARHKLAIQFVELWESLEKS